MIKLYNDDCRNIIEDIKSSYTNICVVTDPPFNVGYHYQTYNDRMKENDYLKFVGGYR